MVRMALQTAEYGEYGTEESRGWWRWHKQQHRMVLMAQRKAVDVGYGTEDNSGWWGRHRGQQMMWITQKTAETG